MYIQKLKKLNKMTTKKTESSPKFFKYFLESEYFCDKNTSGTKRTIASLPTHNVGVFQPNRNQQKYTWTGCCLLGCGSVCGWVWDVCLCMFCVCFHVCAHSTPSLVHRFSVNNIFHLFIWCVCVYRCVDWLWPVNKVILIVK